MTLMNTPAIRRLMVFGAGALIALVGIAGCGDDDDDGMTNEFELVGTWSSNFGGTETITSTSWDFGFTVATLVEFDETANVAITQNPPDASFNADLYSRIEYTEPDNDTFFYCTVAFGLPTLDAARTSTQTADATDPSSGGCGGFTWTQLSRL